MLCLLLTATIWGFAFVSQVEGMAAVSPFFFNALRFTLGALSLLPVLAAIRRRPQGQASPLRTVGVGALCGVVLFAASSLQQHGILLGRSAGRAGFITALYIVMVPLFGLVLRRRVPTPAWLGVAVSIVGFYLLCVRGSFGAVDLGDLLVLASSVLFAVHILVIDTLGHGVDPLWLSFIQFVTTAALSWAGALGDGSVDWTGAADAWIPVLYAGVGSVGIAYTLQVVGQRFVPPTRSAVILSLESFFSAVGGALLLGETMTPRGYAGCALIFVGTLLAQAPARLPFRLRMGGRRR